MRPVAAGYSRPVHRPRAGASRLRAVATREFRLEDRIGRGRVVQQAAPELVEQPLALEGVFPGHGLFDGREVVERGDVGLGADEVAADIVLPSILGDVLADELRHAPAQREEIFVANLPDDAVVAGKRFEIGVAELAAMHLDQPRRRVPMRPVELHLHPDRALEPVAQLFHGRARDLLHVRAHAGPRRQSRGERHAVDQLHRLLAFRLERARDEHFIHELLPLQRRHAGHAFAMRDADAVEIGILLEHLRHAFAQVAFRDVGEVSPGT